MNKLRPSRLRGMKRLTNVPAILEHSGRSFLVQNPQNVPKLVEFGENCKDLATLTTMAQDLKVAGYQSKKIGKLVDFFVWKCRTDEWPPPTEGSPVTSRPFCSCRRGRWPTHRRVWNTRGANKNSATRRWNKSKKLAHGPSNYSLRSVICSFLTANRMNQATIGVPDTGTLDE
jgi:hypothetical protein